MIFRQVSLRYQKILWDVGFFKEQLEIKIKINFCCPSLVCPKGQIDEKPQSENSRGTVPLTHFIIILNPAVIFRPTSALINNHQQWKQYRSPIIILSDHFLLLRTVFVFCYVLFILSLEQILNCYNYSYRLTTVLQLRNLSYLIINQNQLCSVKCLLLQRSKNDNNPCSKDVNLCWFSSIDCVLLKSVEMFFVILLFSNVIPQMK